MGVKSPFSPLNVGAESQNSQDPPGARQGSLQTKSLVPTRPCTPTTVAFQSLPSNILAHILAHRTELSLQAPGGLGEKEPGGSTLSISKGGSPGSSKINSLDQHPHLCFEFHGIWPDISTSPPHCSLSHQGQPQRCLTLSFPRADHLEMALRTCLRAESPRNKGPREATLERHRNTSSQRTLNILLQ